MPSRIPVALVSMLLVVTGPAPAQGTLGDLNCDNLVNTFDIDPFVLALTDPAGYATAYPNCDRLHADCNCDYAVNAFDIDPFVQCLTTGCEPCPPGGACCHVDGTCNVTAQAACAGVWHPEWANCDVAHCAQPTGACCLSDGTCVVSAPADCAGAWHPEWADCLVAECWGPIAACCYPDGECAVTSELGCGGVWHPEWADCSGAHCAQPTGACCYVDGDCAVTTEADCPGVWRPTWADCTVAHCEPPPGMVMIPAGEFQMGDILSEGSSDELPLHAVSLDGFYMDVSEVTNQQYADALNWAWTQGGLITVVDGVVYKHGSGSEYPYCYTTASSSMSCIVWDGSTFNVQSGRMSHPMVEVTWYGAAAYCNWRSAMAGEPLCYDLTSWTCDYAVPGYRLPTEAEWEKAARGGAAGHRFPWSDQDTIQHARCNYWSSASYSYDTSATRLYHPCWSGGTGAPTSAVGFFTGALQVKADWGWPGVAASYQTATGANGYGLHDMAGNVWEWCNDWYDALYYSSSPYANPHCDSGTTRVLRGGAWIYPAPESRVANRVGDLPAYHYGSIGLRCVLR